MNQYSYEGPVKEFGNTINPKWKGTTYAPSVEKARSNLTYQYKKTHNKSASCKITLPGKIVVLA
jgi:hypothetical protein